MDLYIWMDKDYNGFIINCKRICGEKVNAKDQVLFKEPGLLHLLSYFSLLLSLFFCLEYSEKSASFPASML